MAVADSPERITVVRDRAVARQLAIDGYARLGPLLSDEQVHRARAVFAEAVERLDRPLGDAWFPTIMLPEDDVRAYITGELQALIGPELEAVLDAETAELMRLDFSVKPPSPHSELGPHQDFSLVDERSFASLYLWIPLVDTDAANGTLHLVPGSHRFANHIRSQHVPAYFDEVLDLVHASSVRLDCTAGELVLMVSGVIHHSPPNRSGDLRLAAHGIVKPRSAPLVFYFADESTPEDQVECYELDIETYVRQIHHGRPGPEVALARTVSRPPASMTPERFRQGLARVAAPD